MLKIRTPVTLIRRSTSRLDLENASNGIFIHGRMVAGRDARVQGLATKICNHLETRTRHKESPPTNESADRSTPRVQSKAWNCRRSSQTKTRRSAKAKASIRKKAEGNGIIKIHQVPLVANSGRRPRCEKISEPENTELLPPLLGRCKPLV